MQIVPIRHPLRATVRVPGSKSLTNRALLIASLAHGTTKLANALFSDDSRYFANALQTLGFALHLDESKSEITVTGRGGIIPAARAELFIGNAGTAARFLSALLALGRGEFILDGDARMRERPIADLVDALTQLGARVESINGFPPLTIHASGLTGGRVRLAGDISSQFLSALLMVAPYAKTPVEIQLTTDLNSKPYVDMTLAVMQDFGVTAQRDGYRSFSVPLASYKLQGTPRIIGNSYPIESDASAASYFFAAPAICGGSVRVDNISRDSKQGDLAFLDVLTLMGCRVSQGETFIEVSGATTLRGVDVDMRDIPDTAQTLAAVAPFASSPTRIRGIASARLKETDRVRAVCNELTRLGVRVIEHEDGMTIHPCEKFIPATVQTYNDHRMAMAFSLIGLRVDGVSIENPNCVSKTFPFFFETLEQLR
ncbi:MAG: 3-phosphoshikimate 1-carboxyvinyltransferase [Anaerolineales bacterium]|nr:3-phosphoshikimate 1-carboxyvinyltransferase [Anaerolineales bacterium]